MEFLSAAYFVLQLATPFLVAINLVAMTAAAVKYLRS